MNKLFWEVFIMKENKLTYKEKNIIISVERIYNENKSIEEILADILKNNYQ